jgi:7-cyano-7-deazaguanine synthase in queuosine biosynthesis
MLRFLTNDIWNVEFIANDNDSPLPRKKIYPSNDVVVLLSGGLDSLIGTIDLKSRDFEPYAVSQIVRGEQQAQSIFAQQLGGLAHVQFSHSPRFDKEKENSSRARSLLFLAFGTLIATSLERYKDNNQVILYVCENGFISLNPPLTPARLGSLSTRTTHPTFIADFQLLLEKLNLNVKLENPYQLATKGEMLQQCLDQPLISRLAHQSVSCGKYRKHNYMHCGRCLPCLIRRAAFRAWGIRDRTQYKYANLSLEDANHANYDDVRSAAMAISLAKAKGVSGFIDSSLLLQDAVILKSYERLISRGLKELEQLLLSFKKKW